MKLLDTSVASVNSALQRARSTLAPAAGPNTESGPSPEGVDQELLNRYLIAFERYDIDALVTLLPGESATFVISGAPDADALVRRPVLRCIND